MTTLLLCRHGATDWNIEGRYQGQSDVPLNEAGLRQAEQLASELTDAPIEAVYASGLERAWRTAEIIAERHGLSVQRDPRLNEINQGEWEGLTITEIVARYPSEHTLWERAPLLTRPPGGESIPEVQSRVASAVCDIAASHPRGLVVIVAHKVTVTVIRCLATATSLERELVHLPANGSMTRCEWPGLAVLDASS